PAGDTGRATGVSKSGRDGKAHRGAGSASDRGGTGVHTSGSIVQCRSRDESGSRDGAGPVAGRSVATDQRAFRSNALVLGADPRYGQPARAIGINTKHASGNGAGE